MNHNNRRKIKYKTKSKFNMLKFKQKIYNKKKD